MSRLPDLHASTRHFKSATSQSKFVAPAGSAASAGVAGAAAMAAGSVESCKEKTS